MSVEQGAGRELAEVLVLNRRAQHDGGVRARIADFESEHEAASPWWAEHVGELLVNPHERILEPSPSLPGASGHVVAIDEVEHRAGDLAGQAVGAERRGIVFVELLHVAVSLDEDGGDLGEPAAEGFGEEVVVSSYALGSEPRACSPETTLDLVEDEREVLSAQCFQQLLRNHAHSALALHGLDDRRDDIGARYVRRVNGTVAEL
jgi:hypothetical protein